MVGKKGGHGNASENNNRIFVLICQGIEKVIKIRKGHGGFVQDKVKGYFPSARTPT